MKMIKSGNLGSFELGGNTAWNKGLGVRKNWSFNLHPTNLLLGHLSWLPYPHLLHLYNGANNRSLFTVVVGTKWNNACKVLRRELSRGRTSIAYSGLCISELVPGWFPIIMNIKSPVLPLPSFLLSVSKDSSKPYMEAQLSMHNSCLSYLNPASNRTVIVQRNYKGNCEYRQCSNWSQLLSRNWVFCWQLNLMLLFPWGTVLHCCFLLYLWSACHHLHCILHQNDGIVFILLVSPVYAVCFLDPCSSLLTFVSESFHFLLLSTQGRAVLCFGIQRIDFHLWSRRQFFKT